jgi:hypothetical protein
MTNKKTDAGRDQSDLELIEETEKKAARILNKDRVVLNLTTEQAEKLKNFLYLDGVAKGSKFEHYELANKLVKRLDKTILKQAYIARCKADGLPKPTKAQMQGFLEELK